MTSLGTPSSEGGARVPGVLMLYPGPQLGLAVGSSGKYMAVLEVRFWCPDFCPQFEEMGIEVREGNI